MTDDSTMTAPYNLNRSPDYDRAYREAEGMNREEIMRRARQVFSHTNEIRATHTGMANFGVRAAAIEQALAWANICNYMDTTGADCFRMEPYRQRVLRPASRLRKYLRLFSPRAHDWAIQLGNGTEPVTFYKFREHPRHDGE